MVETRLPQVGTQDGTHTPTGAPGALWRDRERSADERADDLLAQLTLPEKVGQLGSRWALNDMTADHGDGAAPAEAPRADDGRPDEVLNVAPMQDVFAASGTSRSRTRQRTVSAT